MTKKVFSIRDNRTSAYLPPFYMHSRGEAERALAETMEDHRHPFAKYTADYTLFELGTFDEIEGQFTNSVAPILVKSLATINYEHTKYKNPPEKTSFEVSNV